jgi:hypothetical protein
MQYTGWLLIHCRRKNVERWPVRVTHRSPFKSQYAWSPQSFLSRHLSWTFFSCYWSSWSRKSSANCHQPTVVDLPGGWKDLIPLWQGLNTSPFLTSWTSRVPFEHFDKSTTVNQSTRWQYHALYSQFLLHMSTLVCLPIWSSFNVLPVVEVLKFQ